MGEHRPPTGRRLPSQILAEGILLRSWSESDGDAIARIVRLTQSAFDDWLPQAPRDLGDFPRYLDRVRSSALDGSAYFYAVIQGGDPVGQCSLEARADNAAEVGYWLRSDRTSRGLATRSVLAVTEVALAAGYERLVIHCDQGNARSAAVARRAGYILEGVTRLDPSIPGTSAQTGWEMTWARTGPD